MSTTHTSEHERMMEALFVGESGADTERVRAELEACGICATRIAELGNVMRNLTAAGDIERADLVRASRLSSAPGSDRVAGTLRNAMSTPSSKPARTTRIWPWLAAAGILAALVFVLAREKGPRRPTNEGTLEGGSGVELSRPEGQVTSYAPFVWTGEIQSDADFVVEVFDPSSKDSNPIDSKSTQEHQWSPPSSETDRWPSRIEWRIKIVVERKPLWTSPSKSAWLSR